MVTNFCTASTAVTESTIVLGTCGSVMSDFTETSESELVSMSDAVDKIAVSSRFSKINFQGKSIYCLFLTLNLILNSNY